MWQQRVQRTVQAIVVDLLLGHAQQITHRRLPREVLSNRKFARRLAQPGNHQHQRHHAPGNVFAPRRDRVPKERVESQHMNQLQRQPRPAERAAVFDANRARIDFDPLRFRIGEQLFLRRSWCVIGGLLDPQTTGFIEFAQMGHHTLPRPTLGAIRFDQRPVRAALTVDRAIVRANEHGPMLPPENRMPRRKVFTTSPSGNPPQTPAPSPNNLQQKNRRKNSEIDDFLT